MALLVYLFHLVPVIFTYLRADCPYDVTTGSGRVTGQKSWPGSISAVSCPPRCVDHSQCIVHDLTTPICLRHTAPMLMLWDLLYSFPQELFLRVAVSCSKTPTHCTSYCVGCSLASDVDSRHQLCVSAALVTAAKVMRCIQCSLVYAAAAHYRCFINSCFTQLLTCVRSLKFNSSFQPRMCQQRSSLRHVIFTESAAHRGTSQTPQRPTMSLLLPAKGA